MISIEKYLEDKIDMTNVDNKNVDNVDNKNIDNEDFSFSYHESRRLLNEIIVELFNNILTIEERSLKKRGIKDLTMTEIHAIEAIGLDGNKTMSEVAEALDITMGTLTTTMSKLEKKGYAQRTKDPKDRRVVVASLTRKGELVEKIHKNFHEEMIDHAMADLKIDEDKALVRALQNINSFFIKEYGRE
ncbi:MarR family winged helix-turn-helix transcriptional regulator [Peptostreptococcus sp. D1]|uniref:MarR family winged helix-turn-helix transcriptional regulator n=1 Tax=Peptostreptococcus sp. D1 TaxID=72304 RepID=UPI000B87172F|nr:MarR family transcriptional regulator [Peptostreptococcus sp. D1]